MADTLVREVTPPAGAAASPVPQYWEPVGAVYEKVQGKDGAAYMATERKFAEATMLASAARTVTGDTSATPTACGKHKEAVFFLDITAASGTTPTLDVVIKTKDPASGKWITLATFTQKTAVGNEMKGQANLLGSQLAVFYTIAGTTPSFTFSVGVVLKD